VKIMAMIKEDWAKSLIAQFLMAFHGGNRAEVERMAEESALAMRPDLMKEFRRLLDLKARMLGGRR